MRVLMPRITTVVASAAHHVERTDQRRRHSAAAVRESTTIVLGPGDRDVAVLIRWLRSRGRELIRRVAVVLDAVLGETDVGMLE